MIGERLVWYDVFPRKDKFIVASVMSQLIKAFALFMIYLCWSVPLWKRVSPESPLHLHGCDNDRKLRATDYSVLSNPLSSTLLPDQLLATLWLVTPYTVYTGQVPVIFGFFALPEFLTSHSLIFLTSFSCLWILLYRYVTSKNLVNGKNLVFTIQNEAFDFFFECLKIVTVNWTTNTI